MTTIELGNRYNVGKPQLSYVFQFPNAVEQLCRVATFGAEKYSRGNWKKGLYVNEIIDSLMRHMTAMTSGEDIDPESGLPHSAHIIWNAMAMAEMMVTRPELDDRDGLIKINGDVVGGKVTLHPNKQATGATVD